MDLYLSIIIYLIVVNFITFITMGADKKKAVKHQYRIPEKTLFFLALIGGSVGGILGMQHFRLKTKHTKFVLGFPFIFVIQVIIGIYCLKIK